MCEKSTLINEKNIIYENYNKLLKIHNDILKLDIEKNEKILKIKEEGKIKKNLDDQDLVDLLEIKCSEIFSKIKSQKNKEDNKEFDQKLIDLQKELEEQKIKNYYLSHRVAEEKNEEYTQIFNEKNNSINKIHKINLD